MSKSISTPNFDKLNPRLLLISENGHPPSWNYTSGFDLTYSSSLVLPFCIGVPNFNFLALTVPEMCRGPKIHKVGHVTPSRSL